MSKDLIRQIAGESGESQSRREQLNKKLWILGKCADTCKRFVGIRGLGKKSHPTSIRILTEFIESSNELQASSQNNRAIVDAIDSEPVDGQSISSSQDLPEQPAQDEYYLEDPIEPEQLLEAPTSLKGGNSNKKNKKGSPGYRYIELPVYSYTQK